MSIQVGLSHPSRGLHCWELCKGSSWEHRFPSLLGERPTSQPVLGGRLGQQTPGGHFPPAFLCFSAHRAHRAGNPDGQRILGSQNSHPFPSQLLLHISTDDWSTLWNELVALGTNHPLCALELEVQEKEPENWVPTQQGA